MVILVSTLIYVQGVDTQLGHSSPVNHERFIQIPELSEYTNHSPIEIWSNQDFEDQGWPGNGTAANPYVIEGLNITTNETGILIFDTTVYYRIENCLISSFGSRDRTGIRTQNAPYGSISNCTIDTHKEGIIVGRDSDFCNVTNTICFNNLFLGIQINGDYCKVWNNTCFGNGGGIRVGGAQHCIVYDNNLTLNRGGMVISSSQFIDAYNNTLEYNSARGFDVEFSDFCTIQQNYVFRSGDEGFFIENIDECTFIENTVLNSSRYGFYLEDTRNCEFRNNIAAYNHWAGFVLDDADDNDIIENNVTQNSEIGITMNIHCTGNRMYLNRLSLHPYDNGRDYSGLNYWDDGVSKGNYWDDYNGRGPYAIGGTGGAYDNYPFSLGIIPYLQHPEDLVVEYGSSDNEIFWDAYDVDPSTYELYIDEVFSFSDAWNGSPIVIDIDGLAISVYNYTVLITDVLGHSAADTVFVTVHDTIAPSINDHPNVVFEYGSSDYTISWAVSDLDPSTYELYVDESLQLSDAWNGSSINITLKDPGITVFNYTLRVMDRSGNSASDTVLVTVQDIISPTVNSPSDIELEEGMTGYNITWVSGDLDPSSYIIYRNEVVIENDVWNSAQITISLDGLPAGIYNFTLVLFDGSGNTAVDCVIVTVTEIASTTTSSPTSTTSTSTTSDTTTASPTVEPTSGQVDPQMILVVAGLGVTIVTILIIAIIMFRKGKT